MSAVIRCPPYPLRRAEACFLLTHTSAPCHTAFLDLTPVGEFSLVYSTKLNSSLWHGPASRLHRKGPNRSVTGREVLMRKTIGAVCAGAAVALAMGMSAGAQAQDKSLTL